MSGQPTCPQCGSSKPGVRRFLGDGHACHHFWHATYYRESTSEGGRLIRKHDTVGGPHDEPPAEVQS